VADASGPFDGSAWSEAEWYRHMPAGMKSGVIGSKVTSATAGALAWSASGLAVTLAIGTANVGGAGYSRTAPATAISVPANTNSTLSRRDRLVLRRSLTTHNVTPVIIQGTPAASPVAPALTFNATTFDLKMFSFLTPPNSGTTLTSVTDERAWVSDGTVDEDILTPLLGEATGASSGTAGDTATSIVTTNITVPVALDSQRRIRVTGISFASTPAGVGLNITVSSSLGFAKTRSINTGSLGGDFIVTAFDTDLTAGARSYSVQVSTTVAGQTLTWRAPTISAELV
jgi:hypothetical protein